MEPGNLVKCEDHGYISYGYVMYLDTDYANNVFCHIRWTDGSETDVYAEDSIIEVIQ